jgi:hypothetical protein
MRNLAITQEHHCSLAELWGWPAAEATTQAVPHSDNGEAL